LEAKDSPLRKEVNEMLVIIGYLVVLGIVVLDFYYHMYMNKGKNRYIYTPFDYLSGQIGDFDKGESAQEAQSHKKQGI